MITGYVTAQLEPRIELHIEDGSGQLFHLDTAIDSGYSGHLTLPPAMIAILALKWLHKRPFVLADRTIIYLDVYSGVVIWDGQARNVDVDAVGQFPLIGLRMLAGHEARIRFVDGGPVWIDLVP
jgi:predicted aspartyl protease